MDTGTVLFLSATLTAVVGNLAKTVYDGYIRKLERRWDVEDRKQKSDDHTRVQETLVAKIDNNTILTQVAATKSEEAAKAANNFNEKLVDLDLKKADKKDV